MLLPLRWIALVHHRVADALGEHVVPERTGAGSLEPGTERPEGRPVVFPGDVVQPVVAVGAAGHGVEHRSRIAGLVADEPVGRFSAGRHVGLEDQLSVIGQLERNRAAFAVLQGKRPSGGKAEPLHGNFHHFAQAVEITRIGNHDPALDATARRQRHKQDSHYEKEPSA